MDGSQAAQPRRLKSTGSLESRATMPVLLSSGFSDMSDRVQSDVTGRSMTVLVPLPLVLLVLWWWFCGCTNRARLEAERRHGPSIASRC